MNHFSHRAPRWSMALLSLGGFCGTVLLAGCGGSGTGSSSGSSHIRSVNAVSNGGSGTLSVNGTSVAGGQNYFTSSSYQSLGNALSTVTFGLSASPSTVYPPVPDSFLAGSYYSLILVGRADITTATDPRYPSLIVTSDTFTTLSGSEAGLRVIHAAPDAGTINVLVNSALAVSGAAFKSVSGYIGEPSGNVTIQATQASTNAALGSPQTVTLTGGQVYTVYVVEPTVSPAPTYGLQETDDTAAVSTG